MKISDIRKYIASLNELLPPEWMDWLPETLEAELNELFPAKLTDEDLEFLMMIIALLKADDAWHDEFIFEKVAHAITENPVSFDHVQPLAPSQAVRAVLVMTDLRPGLLLGHNVKAYIMAVMLDVGITWVPARWGLPEDLNEWLGEERKPESLIQTELGDAYEARKSWEVVETHLSYVLVQMLVVDEMIGLV